MNFTSCTPIPLFSPCLCTCLPPLQLFQTKKKKKSHCGCCGMSQCVPQYTFLFTHLHLQMFIAMNHWSHSRHLASVTLSILDPHRDPSWISCCCHVLWRSSSFGSVGLASSCFLAVDRWVRHWIWAQVVADLVSMPVLPHLHKAENLVSTD